jgi:hypothetical protein
MATNNQGIATAPRPRQKPSLGLIRAYTAELTATTVGAEGRVKPLTFVAPLPDKFQFQLSTNFDNPFNSPVQNLAGGRIGETAGNIVTGVTSMSGLNKYLSHAVWQGGSLFRLTLPFVIVAQHNTITEVLAKMRDMLKLVAPTEVGGKFLRAPGPNYSSVAGQENSPIEGEVITVRLGEFFEMSPCVIEDVACDFDTQMDVDNKCPISATITVSIISYWTTTRQDIDGYFSKKLQPTEPVGG